MAGERTPRRIRRDQIPYSLSVVFDDKVDILVSPTGQVDEDRPALSLFLRKPWWQRPRHGALSMAGMMPSLLERAKKASIASLSLAVT